MDVADKLTLAWETLSNAWERFRKIPGVFSYYKNWEESDINDIPELTSENFKFYVWQTLKFTKDQFYSEEFYVWAIENLLNNTGKTSVINIEVWAELKQILEPKWENSDIRMSTDEQIEYINYIINKYFKKEKKRINVTDLSDNHSELFYKLESDWVKCVLGDEKLNIDTVNSLNIYNLLYKATESDLKFFNRLKKTRPTWAKVDDDENWKYYSLAEIAFRLTDYIKWIYIQWWERRQNVYDVIIRDIITGWYNHIELLKQIYDLIESYNPNIDFESIHFNKKKYDKEQNRKEWVKKIKNYVWWLWLAVSLIVTWWIMWASYIKNQEKQDLQEKIDKAVVELSLGMPEFKDYTDNWMRWEWWLVYEPLEFSKYNSEKLAQRFVHIYWEWDEEWYKFIQLLILQTMKSAEHFFKTHYHLGPTSWYNDFIKNEFIEKNKAILILKWYNIDTLLWNYEEYREAINNTIELEDKELKKYKWMNVSDKKVYKSFYSEYDIGVLECISDTVHFSIAFWVLYCNNDIKWKKFFVAKNNEWEYTLFEWSRVINEFKGLL